jgi:tetratricopeptide (TPR) repeat protein
MLVKHIKSFVASSLSTILISSCSVSNPSLNMKNETEFNSSSQKEKTKSEILQLLAEAKSKREQNKLSLAIDILADAKKIIPSLTNEEGRNTVFSPTHSSATAEILYLNRYANILYKIENYEEALGCYTELLKKLPSNVKVYKAQGDCLRKMQEYEKSIERYQ